MPGNSGIREFKIEGSNVLVTGASSGIGLEFCRALASHSPARVVMISNQAEELSKQSALLSAQFPAVQFPIIDIDLTSSDCASRICEFLEHENIEPDMLINNAGIFSFKEITETTTEKIECFINLHMRAMSLLCRTIGIRMKERRYGRILNMSSMSCWMPMPGLAMYSATKSYIRVFSRALHYEMKDYGVAVTVACPGGIATDLFGLPERWKRLAVRLGILERPESFVAKAIKKSVKGQKQYINGLLNRFSIIAVGASPTWLRMLVKHKLLDKNISR